MKLIQTISPGLYTMQNTNTLLEKYRSL